MGILAMTDSNAAIDFAKLMVKAGFITTEDLSQAIEISEDTAQDIGNVLLRSGFVSEKQLKLAQFLNQQIENGWITADKATKSLQTLRNQ